MKKLIIILAFFTLTMSAQTTWEAIILQDFRMSYSNPAYEELYGGINDYRDFTLNFLVEVKEKDPMANSYFYKNRPKPLVSIGYEYAQLVKEYHRPYFGVGYYLEFNKWFESNLSLNMGTIVRNGHIWFPSMGAHFENAFVIQQKLKIIALAQVVHRTDIEKISNSFFVGIGYKF